MSAVFYPQTDPVLTEVLDAFPFPATLVGAVRYGPGHINDTFCVLCQPQEGDCIRFLTDYLDGDRYFRIHYPEQNLDRCRTQLKLVTDMEEQFEEMAAVVNT